MKSQFVSLVLTAGMTLMGSLSLGAQDSKTVVATVPFAFQANGSAMSAGEYKVSKLDYDAPFQITQISSGHALFVPAPYQKEVKGPAYGHLTFTCVSGDCVLSEIWLPGAETGYARSASSVEKDMQHRIGMATMINVPLHK